MLATMLKVEQVVKVEQVMVVLVLVLVMEVVVVLVGRGPSTLRVWKVGTPCLASVLTFRLPEVGGGEGWSWRGQGGLVVVAASAKEAWWSAARWLRRALALVPRCQ